MHIKNPQAEALTTLYKELFDAFERYHLGGGDPVSGTHVVVAAGKVLCEDYDVDYSKVIVEHVSSSDKELN